MWIGLEAKEQVKNNMYKQTTMDNKQVTYRWTGTSF